MLHNQQINIEKLANNIEHNINHNRNIDLRKTLSSNMDQDLNNKKKFL